MLDLEDFNEPEKLDTSKFTIRDNDGHIVIVQVTGHDPSLASTFQGQDPSPAFFVHVCDLSQKDDDGKPGVVHANVAWASGKSGSPVYDALHAIWQSKGGNPGSFPFVTAAKCGAKRAKSGYMVGFLSKLEPAELAKVKGWLEKNPDPFSGIPSRSTAPAAPATADESLDDLPDAF